MFVKIRAARRQIFFATIIYFLVVAGAKRVCSQENAPLAVGSIVERELAGGPRHRFRFDLAAGQFARLAVKQQGVDVTAELYGPDGAKIAVFEDEPRFNQDETVKFVAAQAGAHQLELKACFPKIAAGSYALRLAEVVAASPSQQAAFESYLLRLQAEQQLETGQLPLARTTITRALALAEQAAGPDSAEVARTLVALVKILNAQADYEAGTLSAQRALSLSERLLGAEHPLTAESLAMMGLMAQGRRDYVPAERYFRQAVALYERTVGPYYPRISAHLTDLSNTMLARNEKAESERLLLRSLAIAEKTLETGHPQFIKIFINLSDYYRAYGSLDKAETLSLRAIELLEKHYGPEHPLVSNALQNLGIIAREKKDYPRAIELYTRAIAIKGKVYGEDGPRVAALLNNIANVYRAQGDYRKAIETQLRVLRIADQSEGAVHGLRLIILGNLARSYAAAGDIHNALRYQVRVDEELEKDLTLRLTVGSEREKLSQLEAGVGRTWRAVSLHAVAAPDNAEARAHALLVLLQRKGRVMDAMSNSLKLLRERSDPADGKLLDDLNAAATQLARLILNGPEQTAPEEFQRQVAALEKQKETLEAAISERSAEFRAQTQPVTLAAVRAALPANTALIEFAAYRPFNPKAESNSEAYSPPRYIAYVLRLSGDVQAAELGDAKTIDEAVDAFRQALRDPQRRDTRQLARALDEKIMRPVRALTGDATRLLISPDGALNLIPFEALADEQNRFLVERFSLNYLTSGRDLLRLQTARQSRQQPLILASPLFGNPSLPAQTRAARPLETARKDKRRSVTEAPDPANLYFAPLPGATQEAASIKSQFAEARLASGPQATETLLKQMVAPKILHIATHGFFIGEVVTVAPKTARSVSAQAKIENPLLRSGLALAGANLREAGGDDGILTALEAAGLNLWGTKLVVLSACDTGVGEVKTGEGVYGLRRAFVLAGTESLVMSLWPVSDYVTRELMAGYYKGLKRGGGRGEALRQVQLALLKRQDRQHPFYWASFIQAGEWANLSGQR
jgi:CHAT domain-containing protein